MEYSKSYDNQVESLSKLLLGKISYSEWRKIYEKGKRDYKMIFESDSFKEFSEKMYDFFGKKEVIKKRLIHEKKHFDINNKYGIKSKFILKSYEREGKIRHRPSVVDSSKDDKKSKWTKKKLWKYYYKQTNMVDASDNDKKMRKMLLEIKDQLNVGK